MYKFLFIIVVIFINYNQSKSQTLAANIDSFYLIKEGLNDDNKLYWVCSNQFNLNNFILEKSMDKGLSWAKMGEMPAAAANFGANQQATYNFWDRFANRSKSAVYRLKSVEKPNYLVDYFPLIWNEVNFIYATYHQQLKRLQISHTWGLDKVVDIKIYNMQQQLVFEKTLTLSQNNIGVDIGLREGFYFIKYDNIVQKLAVLY